MQTTGNSSMTEYTWNEEFYRAIIDDHNYRFPKFSYIEYPKFKEEGDNEYTHDSEGC